MSFLQGKHRPMIHVVVDDEGETNNHELKKFETRNQIVSPLVSILFRYRGIVKYDTAR